MLKDDSNTLFLVQILKTGNLKVPKDLHNRMLDGFGLMANVHME